MTDGVSQDLRQLTPSAQREMGSEGGEQPSRRAVRKNKTYKPNPTPRLFEERELSKSERKLAAVVTAAMVLMAAVVTPYATEPLSPAPGFVVAYSTAQIILSFLVAVLLLCKSNIENDHNHLNLAGAYLFCGLIVTMHLLTFPNAFIRGTILGAAGSTTWMWTFWHGGFPLLIIGCCLRAGRGGRAPPRARDAMLVAVTLASVLSVVAIFHVKDLPLIIQGIRFFPGADGTLIRAGLVLINVMALVFVLATFRLRTSEGLWLAVGMVGICVDVWMSLRSGQRYTLGWYCGRLGGISSVFVIFSSLLNDVLADLQFGGGGE